MLRVPCMTCHAPANVLDLLPGARPWERVEDAKLGGDCVYCHVPQEGIRGPGRSKAVPHEVIADKRLRNPMIASATLCATYHEEDRSKTVTEWRPSAFALKRVSYLHCHMPKVRALSTGGGIERSRRSHSFLADKDIATLAQALNTEVRLTADRKAVVRLTNDRTGHSLPASGMNSLIVRVAAKDELGNQIDQAERVFGSREIIPGYRDFWPFRNDTSIPAGESRQIEIQLPAGHGSIAAEFCYRDWFAIEDRDRAIARLSRKY